LTRKENRFVTFKLRRVSFRPLEPSDETIEKISIHSGVARKSSSYTARWCG